MIDRRGMMKAAGAALALPSIVRAQSSRLLKFVPSVDLAILDPIVTTAQITLIHGNAVFDTLYGLNAHYQVKPQMVEGHVSDDGGRVWTLTLREGLRFHDNEPVRGRDVVVSLRRWGMQDAFGKTLFGAIDELMAPDDRTIRFHLKSPFPLLPAALGKPGSNLPAIMPERLALTPPNKPVAEMVGSGPFRFVANEWVSGSRVVYERFAGYVPRQGNEGFVAAPKIAHFDRVEWTIIPDEATATNALRAREVDWRDWISNDFVPVLRADPNLVVMPGAVPNMSLMIVNQLQKPFDNAAIRRAVLSAINQEDFMIAVSGADRSFWRTGTGMFNSASPMANNAGIEAMTSPRDIGRARRAIVDAGYTNEPVVLFDPADSPGLHGQTLVGADLLSKLGMKVELRTMDWGTLVQRRNNQEAPDKGGWSVLLLGLSVFNGFDPASNYALRGAGRDGWFGWPTSARLEELRSAWLATGDLSQQREICRQMQLRAFQDVPCMPLGEYNQINAYHRSLIGVPGEFPLFYNVRRG
jgi:peptide/nickel transport system substrate-binding protein